MRKADLPAAASELLTARERRESEKLVTDWEQEKRRLGDALALMTLDVSAMSGPKWAHRFVIAVRPVVEDSSLLFYGPRLASLWELPETPDHSIPMTAQLPTRYLPGIHERLYRRDSFQRSRPDAGRGRTRGRRTGALPSSVCPLEPRPEPCAAFCARRVQLPRGRHTVRRKCIEQHAEHNEQRDIAHHLDKASREAAPEAIGHPHCSGSRARQSRRLAEPAQKAARGGCVRVVKVDA